MASFHGCFEIILRDKAFNKKTVVHVMTCLLQRGKLECKVKCTLLKSIATDKMTKFFNEAALSYKLPPIEKLNTFATSGSMQDIFELCEKESDTYSITALAYADEDRKKFSFLSVTVTLRNIGLLYKEKQVSLPDVQECFRYLAFEKLCSDGYLKLLSPNFFDVESTLIPAQIARNMKLAIREFEQKIHKREADDLIKKQFAFLSFPDAASFQKYENILASQIFDMQEMNVFIEAKKESLQTALENRGYASVESLEFLEKIGGGILSSNDEINGHCLFVFVAVDDKMQNATIVMVKVKAVNKKIPKTKPEILNNCLRHVALCKIKSKGLHE